MRLFQTTRIFVLVLSITLGLQGQAPQPDTKGIPPRATPGDYQTKEQAGTVTIAAEFTGHSLPTADGPLTTEEYVGVEVALFGPAGASLKISADDFSLRVNGKKILPSQRFGMTLTSLRDPEWVPPDPPAQKS